MAHLELLVLHRREVRVLTRRVVGPFVAFTAVVLATVALAEWVPFRPAVPKAAGANVSAADLYLGENLFVASCSACHGVAGAGGGVGPRLAGSGLTATDVAGVLATGRGAMPPGIVEGAEAGAVAAYVASIAGP